MEEFFKLLKDNSNLIAYVSLLLSCSTFYITRQNSIRFARNEFIKKQIQEVIELTSYLNSEMIELDFTHFHDDGSNATCYKTNIFEIKNLAHVSIAVTYRHRAICFKNTCNQILDIRRYINNPFIPKSIANELAKFYCYGHMDLIASQVIHQHIIVIDSNTFEHNDFQLQSNDHVRLREPLAFAFESFDNLVVCVSLLEKSIVTWLEKYKVDEINLRSNMWREE